MAFLVRRVPAPGYCPRSTRRWWCAPRVRMIAEGWRARSCANRIRVHVRVSRLVRGRCCLQAQGERCLSAPPAHPSCSRSRLCREPPSSPRHALPCCARVCRAQGWRSYTCEGALATGRRSLGAAGACGRWMRPSAGDAARENCVGSWRDSGSC